MNTAVKQVIATFGRIDVLVSNAGCGLAGAVEEVPDECLQQVFDVNLYVPMRLVRAVVPHMRRQKSGVIIHVSSIGGRVAMPFTAAYGAAKFALEAISDALRLELMPFGIKVVVVEPGTIVTKFAETLRNKAEALLVNPNSPYSRQYEAMDKLSTGMYAHAPGPEIVSVAIQRIIAARSPKARYSMPAGQALQTQLMRLLPDAWRDRLLASVFGIKRLA